MVAPKIISGPCPTVPAARDFLQLLSTLHEVIPYIPDSTSVVNVAVIPQPPSIKTCPPAEVKLQASLTISSLFIFHLLTHR